MHVIRNSGHLNYFISIMYIFIITVDEVNCIKINAKNMKFLFLCDWKI